MTKHDYTGLLGEIADLLLALEEEHHLHGWDNRPATMYRVHRGSNSRLGVQSARLGLIGHHPRDELRALADAADHPEHAAFMESSSSSPPLAHLLITETWMRSYEAGEEQQADEDARRRFADMPGSFECRYATAIVGKRLITLNRRRGEPPMFMDLQTADAIDEKARMSISLRDLHQRVARHWRQPVGL